MSSGNISAEWGMFVNAGIGDPLLPHNTGAGLDYGRYTPSTVKRFTDNPVAGVALPDDANSAVIVIEGGDVRYRVGATNATAAEGVTWFANTSHTYENQRAFLQNVSFIDVSAAATVRVLWGRV